MAKQDYFKNALSGFTFENASGGAIRHLADLGYSVLQIQEQLAFPTPYTKIQQTVWEHLLDTGVIRLSEPGSGNSTEKSTFIKEYDRYGKVSFRKVTLPSDEPAPVRFKEVCFNPSDSFSEYLCQKLASNHSSASYVSCNFGLMEPASFECLLGELNDKQRDYLQGIPWAKQVCYHVLNQRMQEILIRLYDRELYHGFCFFVKTCEKIKF